MKISVGQALLILMKHYVHDKRTQTELKKLYLSGAKDTESVDKINTFLLDDALIDYKVSRDFESINEDKTRRYFETKLAYYTVINSVKNIELHDNVFKPSLTISGFILNDAVLQLQFTLCEDDKKVIEDMAKKLNLEAALPSNYHMTLAYNYQFIESISTYQNIRAFLSTVIIPKQDATIALKPPQLCTFNHMGDLFP